MSPFSPWAGCRDKQALACKQHLTRAWFSAHMSASVQLEPPADGAGGDAPVGVLDPTHGFEVQAFSWSSRSQGRVPDVGAGGGDEGSHQRSRCVQLGCWRELQGSAEVGMWVWVATRPFYVSRSSRARLGPLARSWCQGKKLAKISYLFHVRVCGRFGELEPLRLLTHPIPSHPTSRPGAGIWGLGRGHLHGPDAAGDWPVLVDPSRKKKDGASGSDRPVVCLCPHRSVEKGMALDGIRGGTRWHWMGGLSGLSGCTPQPGAWSHDGSSAGAVMALDNDGDQQK